jgi:hypothetical protein
MAFPRMVPVLQRFPSRALPNIPRAVRDELAASRITAGLPAKARIAVAVGSRGVANLAEIVRAAINHFREAGFTPFIVPAMGSHGGGTGPGQVDVLAHYGVTEASMACPILSSIETVSMGNTPDGIETCLDRNAFESDGVFLINRVKWHTSFEAPIESGLMKMAAIGLGKVQGATSYHRHGVRVGLGNVVLSVGRHILASGKILGGLAVVEDAHHQTARVSALPFAGLEEAESALLTLARSWMARILFDEVDVLVIDEVGKHISGTGMDSKVINRHPYGQVNPWPWAPRVMRVHIRDISPQSYGNAVGMGMADTISERFYQKIDWHSTRVNALAASNLSVIRTPLRMASDREALETLAAAVGRKDPSTVTYVRIKNTLELSNITVSENLLPGPENVEVTAVPSLMTFDAEGNLAETGVPALLPAELSQ